LLQLERAASLLGARQTGAFEIRSDGEGHAKRRQNGRQEIRRAKTAWEGSSRSDLLELVLESIELRAAGNRRVAFHGLDP
jgi:hypothetical protein